MITINFHNVGRNHISWTEELASESEIANAVRKKKVLMSKDIWAESGIVFAGGRPVGKYTIGTERVLVE